MRLPVATYRIQLNPLFGFRQTGQIVKYLEDLGISHVYASPIFKAKKGSMHGYDVVDPTQLNTELGTWDEFLELTTHIQSRNMGWIQDIVPNHMAFDTENAILMDILENGTSSWYANFFDIDLNHPYENLRGKLLAPFLGRMYAECLESGEIQLSYDSTGLKVNYYDIKFPLKIESYFPVFAHNLIALEQTLGKNHSELIKFKGILYVLKSSSEESGKISHEQVNLGKKMLWEVYGGNPKIREFIDRNIQFFNGQKGVPESFNLLDNILSQQFFRLAFWKVATEEINYRRFFNINGLISLRIQEQKVFDYTHSLILKLIREQKFSGVRVDHIDGLYDPQNYLKNLHEKAQDAYIVIEKILEMEESLPAWPVQGTTGYDFLNFVNGLFCQDRNVNEMSEVYSRFASFPLSFEKMVWDRKRLIMGKHMASDIDNLAHLMKNVFGRHRYGRDIALYGLKRALVEVMALFPLYRTYITAEGITPQDQNTIRSTVAKAKETNPELFYNLNLIEKFLLLDFDKDLSDEERAIWLHFVMRFQQFTGPLMAKALEDTLFYVYNRLLSLNEVGGNPNKFGITIEEFHSFNRQRMKTLPNAMNTTSTHDTKRSEDVRARLNTLSEIPQEWEKNLRAWCALNRDKKSLVKGVPIPDSNDEYFLYQTLLSAFPFEENEYLSFLRRIEEYIIKAVREAKVHTAWLKPDIEYENAYLAFIKNILPSSGTSLFLQEFRTFQKKIARYGIFNSLSQTFLKIVSPGIPDFYQGTELWDFSLVDPDNRRPVDFQKRASCLKSIQDKEREGVLPLIAEILSTMNDGRVKLFLIYRLMKARKENQELFASGEYIPLKSEGKWKDHVIGFVRKTEKRCAIALAPMLLTAIIQENELPLGEKIWQDTCLVLPENLSMKWQDTITNQQWQTSAKIYLGQILQNFPCALLLNE